MAWAAQTTKVTVVYTTDVHGRVLPWDYFKGRSEDVGLARVSTWVKTLRRETPNLLLLDNGDTLQGTPLTYYFERLHPERPNPMMAVMNAMGYDSMAVGNHEFNYGLEVLEKCRAEAHFPILSANTLRTDGGESPFKPYIVKTFGGVKIGVLGLTTSNIPNWETPDHYRNLSFESTVEAARKWVRILREKEKVDAVVVTTHEGFEVDLDTGRPNGSSNENQAWALSNGVPGIDVVLTGHAHMDLPPRLLPNGVMIAQGFRYAAVATRVDLTFERRGNHWVLAQKTGQRVPMDGSVAADPEIEALIRPSHEEVAKWVEGQIGTATDDFPSQDVFVQDTAILDLVQKVMLDTSKADFALAPFLPGGSFTLRKGPIRVRDIYQLYPFENTLAVIRVKGKDIQAALEHAAEFYQSVNWDPATGLHITPNPDFRKYNFDTLTGARYALDPTKPVGKRLLYLEGPDGKPLDPEREYTLATTNYRAAGGGNYASLAHKELLPSTTSEEVRNLIIEYIRRQGTISPVCDRNWSLTVPASMTFPEKAR